MKSQKGITLTSLVIYVVAMVVIVGIVGTITSFFYSNTADMNESATNLGEFNKFNVAFLNEVKKQGNSVLKLENNDTRIVFSSGTSFTFQDGGIYQDKVKIATGVTNCQFSTRKQEEKQIITVLIEIGQNVPFVRTLEYVMSFDNITSSSSLEEDFSQNTNEYVKNGLQLHYDAINNTGYGHSNTTTTWRDLSGNHRDGVLNNVTWRGDSAVFDGTSSWVNCGEINYEYLTLEAVVQTGNPSKATQALIANWHVGGAGIYFKNGTIAIEFNINGTYSTNITEIPIPENSITSVVGTYDGTTLKLYLNCNKIFETELTGVITPPIYNTVCALGVNPKGNEIENSLFIGNFYSARIYDRALTEQEIIYNYELDKARYGI